MPAFTLKEAPEGFAAARTTGLEWLRNHPNAKRPRDLWSPFRGELRRQFDSLCGYSLMQEQRGSVDHYVPFRDDRSKAYDWDNYRFANSNVNSSKKTKKVWDPFEIEFEWFEIDLRNMFMVLSPSAPHNLKDLLQYTLENLPICDDDESITFRMKFYRFYKDKKAHIDVLRNVVPVLALTIERYEDEGLPLP